MRPVDADKIIKDLTAMMRVYDAISLDGMIKGLRNAPTINPEDLREKGRWVSNGIPDSMLSKCTVCGFPCGAYSFSYCPICGSRMEVDHDTD